MIYMTEAVWSLLPIWYPLSGIVAICVVTTLVGLVAGRLRSDTHSWYLLPFYAVIDEFRWHIPGSRRLKAEFIRSEAEWHVSRGGGFVGGRTRHWDAHEILERNLCHQCALDYFDPSYRVWLLALGVFVLGPISLIVSAIGYFVAHKLAEYF